MRAAQEERSSTLFSQWRPAETLLIRAAAPPDSGRLFRHQSGVPKGKQVGDTAPRGLPSPGAACAGGAPTRRSCDRQQARSPPPCPYDSTPSRPPRPRAAAPAPGGPSAPDTEFEAHAGGLHAPSSRSRASAGTRWPWRWAESITASSAACSGCCARTTKPRRRRDKVRISPSVCRLRKWMFLTPQASAGLFAVTSKIR